MHKHMCIIFFVLLSVFHDLATPCPFASSANSQNFNILPLIKNPTSFHKGSSKSGMQQWIKFNQVGVK
eukprot:scaffold37070_cov18-Tisochrysis_lutea.AAC.2